MTDNDNDNDGDDEGERDGLFLDVFEESFELQSEIPGILVVEMSILVDGYADETEANIVLRDFMRYVPKPHERARFREFLLRPRPDGTLIGIRTLVEIYRAAIAVYGTPQLAGDVA